MPIDAAERERRRTLLATHYDAENRHDLPEILATFSPCWRISGGSMPLVRAAVDASSFMPGWRPISAARFFAISPSAASSARAGETSQSRITTSAAATTVLTWATAKSACPCR